MCEVDEPALGEYLSTKCNTNVFPRTRGKIRATSNQLTNWWMDGMVCCSKNPF